MIDAEEILSATGWAGLTHAHGSAADLPEQLEGLLSEDPDRIGESLRTLHGSVLHQGSIHPATAPVARYVAAILADPRTATEYHDPEDDGPRPVRTHLLTWLDDVAGAAIDFDDDTVMPLLPELREAVLPHLDDEDETVRDAATTFLETVED